MRNTSEQFEARLSLGRGRLESPSLFLDGMAGSRMPIATSHGEGEPVFDSDYRTLRLRHMVAMRYVDNYGNVADKLSRRIRTVRMTAFADYPTMTAASRS